MSDSDKDLDWDPAAAEAADAEFYKTLDANPKFAWMRGIVEGLSETFHAVSELDDDMRHGYTALFTPVEDGEDTVLVLIGYEHPQGEDNFPFLFLRRGPKPANIEVTDIPVEFVEKQLTDYITRWLALNPNRRPLVQSSAPHFLFSFCKTLKGKVLASSFPDDQMHMSPEDKPIVAFVIDEDEGPVVYAFSFNLNALRTGEH